MEGGVEFEWDDDNVRHLKRHRVSVQEFEELINGEPLYLEYQAAGDEERHKVLGVSKAGRVLVAIWTPRGGRVRAVTAYGAGRTYRKLYWETVG